MPTTTDVGKGRGEGGYQRFSTTPPHSYLPNASHSPLIHTHVFLMQRLISFCCSLPMLDADLKATSNAGVVSTAECAPIPMVLTVAELPALLPWLNTCLPGAMKMYAEVRRCATQGPEADEQVMMLPDAWARLQNWRPGDLDPGVACLRRSIGVSRTGQPRLQLCLHASTAAHATPLMAAAPYGLALEGEQWSVLYSGLDADLVPHAIAVARESPHWRQLQLSSDHWVIPCVMLWEPRRPKAPPVGPENVTLRPLREHDAAVVNAHWEYGKTERSLEVHVLPCLRQRPSCGLWVSVRQGPDPLLCPDGETEAAPDGARRLEHDPVPCLGGDSPVAWALCERTDDCLCKVFTLEEYRQRGYSAAVCGTLTALLWDRIEEGTAFCQAPYCFVTVENQLSRRLFSSLGYELAADVVWVGF